MEFNQFSTQNKTPRTEYYIFIFILQYFGKYYTLLTPVNLKCKIYIQLYMPDTGGKLISAFLRRRNIQKNLRTYEYIGQKGGFNANWHIG